MAGRDEAPQSNLVQLRARLASLVALAMTGGAVACGSAAPPSEEERLRAKLDRTSVHVSVAMREALADPSADRALHDALEAVRDVAPGGDAQGLEERAASAAWDARQRGRDRIDRGEDDLTPPIVAGPREGWSEDADRTALLLASLVLDAHPEPRQQARAIKSVLLYEASRIDPAGAGPELAPVAHALRASTFASAGLCDLARVDAEASLAAEARMDPTAAARRLLGAAPESDGGAAWLGVAVRSLARGALACCAVRGRREQSVSEQLEAIVVDARSVGASPSTIALLETWAAVGRGDRSGAHERLAEVADLSLTSEEVAKYHVLRDRLASEHGGEEGARMLDRAWIGATTARIAAQAVVGAGALEAMDHEAAGRAAGTARALSRTLLAARVLHPGFEQAADQGRFWDAVASLFGGGG